MNFSSSSYLKGKIFRKQECVSEDKDGLRRRLRCPGDYTRRDFSKMQVYCPTSKNQ